MVETSLEASRVDKSTSDSEAATESSAEQLGNESRTPDHSTTANAPVDSNQKRSSLYTEIAKYLISILILGFGIFVMTTMHGFRKPPAEQESKELIPMVQTVPAKPYSGQLDKTVSGTVVPFREIRVAAEISGNVVSKFSDFEAGNFVKKGTRLLEIDPTDYQMQLDTGMAEVDQTEKMVQETLREIAGAKRNISNATNDYKLAKSAHQRNMKIRDALSTSELDQSKRSLLGAQTTLTTCENNLEMMEAKLERMNSTLALTKLQLDRAKTNLNRTVVVAPDDGVIVREMVQEGDYVRAGDPLVMFEDTSRSEVLCNLTPTDLTWIRNNSVANNELANQENPKTFSPYYLPKTNVSIFEGSDNGVVWNGVLERFDGIGREEKTRTIPVRITVDEPIVEFGQERHALVRGMFVKCKIEVPTSDDNSERAFLSFPSVALHPGNHVWVVKDKKLQRVDVEVVDYGDQLIGQELTRIVIVAMETGSLELGDAIVVTPIPQPKEGKEVLSDHSDSQQQEGHSPMPNSSGTKDASENQGEEASSS